MVPSFSLKCLEGSCCLQTGNTDVQYPQREEHTVNTDVQSPQREGHTVNTDVQSPNREKDTQSTLKYNHLTERRTHRQH